MSHVAVAAVGDDRPGIVAAVTGVLMQHGCNLEDTSMTILRGHFAMMLVVECPPGVGATALEHAIETATGSLDLVVSVRPIGDGHTSRPEGNGWTIVVYGGDRPGIVHRMSADLADAGVNIIDLTTQVSGEQDRPVYSMVLEVVTPASLGEPELAALLETAAAELGVECTLRRADADIL
ncbi:MAG: glycine cleavage system protein R [Acidimicrobiales bacterium]